MHGGEGEERKRSRPMRPVLINGTAAESNKPAPVLLPRTPNSFLKDGRKIQVGDCALFQAGNASPLIGIIRRLSTGKEYCLKLCVNWLYRPADVKLGNGLLLEAAPNEVFYSSHKDTIAVVSLLHPCKVAFLGKGVELPSGTSSFVCRRFYDIDNRHLWWLTDQGYIKKRREEFDQLLAKTWQEMHATVQSTESLQNNGTTFSSKIKGKKRGIGDQGMESAKRERAVITDDRDYAVCKFDDKMIKAEISKITEKGALITTNGVEELVQLMQVNHNGKLDIAGRVLLVDVIAATDRIDCLTKFVQIRGLSILDEWLQEAHKGKPGDGSSPKETDKAVEELVLSVLRALDKLPVNLNALQSCNIGKSVNHLRSSKNQEIHKKARSLVDTWKKRVDAELKTIDAKTVGSNNAITWSVKPGFAEIAHAANQRSGSTELSMKSSMTQQSTFKALPGKCVPSDGVFRSTTLIAGSNVQSPSLEPAAFSTNTVGGNGALDLPHVVVKEEKSSSSSQSQNNCQSCSSDHAKSISPSLKEVARSSSAKSVNARKISVGSSHPRSSSSGYMGSSVSVGQKDSSKSCSISRTLVGDKVSQPVISCARIFDIPVSNHGSNRKFIVRMPNQNRSPVRSISGSSLENSSAGSRASSPGVSDKHGHGDPKGKTRNDSGQNDISANLNAADSLQSKDVKEKLVGCDEGDGSPIVIPEEEVRGVVEGVSVAEISRTACSLSGNESGTACTDPKRRNSFSSMNALVESCAKYSEASTPSPDGDDVGMNLLASVATEEMPKTDLVSSAASPGSSSMKEDHCTGSNEAKIRFFSGGAGCQIFSPSAENSDLDSHKDENESGAVFAKDQIQEVGPKFACNDKNMALLLDGIMEAFDREDVDQNKDTQGVDGQGDCQDASDRKASVEEHSGSTSSSHVMANSAEAVARKGSFESCVSGSFDNDELPAIPREAEASAIKEELLSAAEATSFISSAEQDTGLRCSFDLNEGLSDEDVSQTEPVITAASGSTATRMPSLPSFIPSLVLCNLPASITVAAPVKGPFLPPENLLKCNGEPGWKGSAATSAFRPAEPRKVLGILLAADAQLSESATAKRDHSQFNIDLNVSEERVLDLASENSPETTESESIVFNNNNPSAQAIGGLGLDLNRFDEDMENGHCSASSNCRLEVLHLPERSASDTSVSGETNKLRDFDLNNGPVLTEVGAQPVLRRQMPKSSGNVSFFPSITALKMNQNDARFGWFPPGNSYPAVAAPLLPDRGGSSYPVVVAAGAQTILRPVTGSGAYRSDIYRGPVLSSSPAMTFSPGATSLPYAGFPFGFTFPSAATCFTTGPTTFIDSSAGGGSYFPPIFSQLVGPVGAMPSLYPRPSVVSLTDGNASGVTESNRKWGRQGLDLNTGPTCPEELKEERMPSSSRQISVTSSHTFMDQARLYQLGSGSSKRKVPGAWETER